ncbi:MAG: YybH family protein [Gammaproteobacteria bacterium]
MYRIRLVSWVALIALAAAAGCERAETPEPFPQAAADGWLAAFNSGDAAGLALMYSENSQLLPPDEPIVSGHGAIEGFWQRYNPGQVRLELSGVQSERVGAYWFREGTYSAKFADEGEPRIGKFIELWVKIDNAWLLHRHMWSPNSPPPAEPPPAMAG